MVCLRDENNDGKADVIKYHGIYDGTGIKIHDGFVYFGADTLIVRYQLKEGELVPDENAEIIADMQPASEMQLQLRGTTLKINYMPFSTVETNFHNSFLNYIQSNKILKFLLKNFCWLKTDQILAGLIAISIWRRIKKYWVLNMVVTG